MDLSFSNLLTDLGLDPPSLVDLGGDVREGMLVNSTGFRGEKQLVFLFAGMVGALIVNSSLILLWNDLKLSPTSRLSYPPL